MDTIFPRLFTKTFFILTVQFMITWLSAHFTLSYFRSLYRQKMDWIRAKSNKQGYLDLQIDQKKIQTPLSVLIAIYFATFFFLQFYAYEFLLLGLITFSIWSIQVGVIVALCMLAVDENMGLRAVSLTIAITILAAVIGIFSGIDFGFMGLGLFIALLLLIIWRITSIFFDMPRWKERIISGIGGLIFTLYLMHDFNALQKAHGAGVNDWPSAIHISIRIYLDVINLLLEILAAMSD